MALRDRLSREIVELDRQIARELATSSAELAELRTRRGILVAGMAALVRAVELAVDELEARKA